MAGARVCRIVCLFALLATGAAIDCYVCTSINGSNEACEDEFLLDLTTVHFIARRCQYGYFSGTHCIKLKGIKEDGTRILVRHCSDADWGKDCGEIRYIYGENHNERIQGCLTTCNYNGCNSAPSQLALSPVLLLTVGVVVTLVWDRHGALAAAGLF